MKWPTTNKSSNKPDLSSLSDDQLDDLMIVAGLMDQNDLDRQRDTRLIIAMANLPGGPPEYHETLRGLIELYKEGQLPREAQDLYDRLNVRAMADVKAARKAAPKVTSSPADVPADMSVAGWLKFKWHSADASVRHALQAVASAVGASIPMSRTRNSSVGVPDSSPSQRSKPTRHTSHAEQDPLEGPAEKEQPDESGYHDPPEWHDDASPDWEPCSDLHDALHPREEWY